MVLGTQDIVINKTLSTYTKFAILWEGLSIKFVLMKARK